MITITRRMQHAMAIILLLSSSLIAQPAPRPVTGDWAGALSISGIKLRLVLHVKPSDDGGWSATLDSPDQGVKDIPVSAVITSYDSLILLAPVIHGEYRGAFRDDTTLVGTWTQGHKPLDLVLTKLAAPFELRRPQEPKPPFPYREELAWIANTADGVTLAGTLTLPQGAGPFPAVVLISGSGPQDRDESLLGHKPFAVLADHLTRRGIAVLRFDDRGVGKSTGHFASAVSTDFTRDVQACVAWLKEHADIDAKHIGLVGHSEGGMIAPMVAADSRDVAFIVLMAGPGTTGRAIVVDQSCLIQKASGVADSSIEQTRTTLNRLYDVVTGTADSATAATRLRAIILDSIAPEDRGKEGRDAKSIDLQIRQMLSPWFRYFLAYDPAPVLARVSCPVLAINGGLDLQVPAEKNLDGIRRALTSAGNTEVEIRSFPGLNHLFQHANTGTPAEYGEIEETMSPDVLEAVTAWISRVCK